PEGATVAPVDLPSGVTLRAAVPGVEDREVHRVIEDAFNEWPDRDPTTFEDWAPGNVGRLGFEPWMLQVAVELGPEGDRLVGACFTIVTDEVGYVDSLAVRADRRGLGLGQALLVRGFDQAREHGA